MLSYQHSYHAGNLVDAHKHARLAEILSSRRADAAPIAYYETHAGRGLYNLQGKEARKTGEAEEGKKAISALSPSHPYRRCIAQTQKQYGASFYPGSPLIAQSLLHPQDRMQLFELHPQEFVALTKAVKGAHVHVAQADGFQAMLALPPKFAAREGLLLIDPSYEIKADYVNMTSWLQKLLAHCPNLSVLLWYPLLQAGLHKPMCEALLRAFPHSGCDEMTFPKDSRLRMQGSGLWSVGELCG